jgi:dTDP-glucose pyrophosphorylase
MHPPPGPANEMQKKPDVNEEDVVVILGDNIFQDSIRDDVHSFIESGGYGGERNTVDIERIQNLI